MELRKLAPMLLSASAIAVALPAIAQTQDGRYSNGDTAMHHDVTTPSSSHSPDDQVPRRGMSQPMQPAAAPANGWSPPIQPQVSHSGVRFVAGGYGSDHRSEMSHKFGQYGLKLVNTARNEGGAYVGGVQIRIDDAHGQTVLQTSDAGPWLMADLGQGRYTVHASRDGKTQTRTINVNPGHQQQLRLSWTDVNMGSGPTPAHGRS